MSEGAILEPNPIEIPAAEDIRSAQATNKLGVLRIVSIVIACSAPMAVVAGYLAVVMADGNGLGAPMAFLVIGLILLTFAIGYTELAKAVPHTGGFYVYLTAGLGRPIGLAGTLVALFSYSLIAAGTYALFGLAAERFVADEIGGPAIPWWVFVAGAWLLSSFLSYRELSASARLLGISIILEFALVLTFDAAVLFHGGGSAGFSHIPLSLSAAVSGAPGLALLFAAGMFVGFESTTVYRDEARDPDKTIPRATLIHVTVLTLFYASTTYLLITALGVGQAVAIASADSAKAFPLALTQVLGSTATAIGYLLLCASLYGAALSLQNVLARYVFRLGAQGLFPTSIGRLHPKYRSPSLASVYCAVALALVIAPFIALGISPAVFYARLVGVGTFGVIMLLFLTSIAVIVYFRRSKQRPGPIRSVVAPTIAALGLASVFALANMNFVELTGTSATVAHRILATVYLVLLAGLVWAYWLRIFRPRIYSVIG